MRRVQSTLFALLAASSSVFAETQYNLTQGVSPISHDVYELHMTVFWLCVVIGILVFGVMFYSIIHHRKSRGAKPAKFHSHFLLELTWTIVPALILVVIAIPATKVLLNMNNNDQEELTVKITGYQWKWQYEYIEDGVKFFSQLSTPSEQMRNLAPKGEHYLQEVDHPLVLPIHKKIRFLITSNDVNHAWWVPDLAIKRDAIAGIINEGWTMINKPGTYRGQCAELCGINHAFMPIVVVAVTEDAYKEWVAQQKGETGSEQADTEKAWTMQELTARGQQVYERVCSACHQANGAGVPPTFPALDGSKIALGPIKDHVDIVLHGKPGTAMQAFENQLSDVEIAAVVTYERNAWKNQTGTSVQPIVIKSLHAGKSIDEAFASRPTGKVTQSKTTSSPSTKEKTVKPVVTPAAMTKEDQLKEVMLRGEKIYLTYCAMCHQPDGNGMPPTFPALKGSPIATGPVDAHIHQVVHGKPGTAMQAFKDQLDDQAIADVVTYERHAWGNNKGEIVSAEQVKAIRAQQ